MISWRAGIFAPATIGLFAIALWRNSAGDGLRALVCLGLAIATAMLWAILAARASDDPATPLRQFIPRLTFFVVIGSVFLALMRWQTDWRITVIETGFAILYILMGVIAIRALDAAHRGPRLTPIAGGKAAPRNRD
ncbi:MAG: hypothetical protein IVW56_02300 [Candidatus Binataceae bacterium]|nr:hypothetical protein [Candidatus Binataceae bacterium]